MKVIDHPKPIAGTERSACPLYVLPKLSHDGMADVCIRQGWRFVPVGCVKPEELSDPAALASLAAAGRQLADIVPPDYSDEPPGEHGPHSYFHPSDALPDVIRYGTDGKPAAYALDKSGGLQDDRDGALLAAHVAAYLKHDPEPRADGSFLLATVQRLQASGKEGGRHLVGFLAAIERYVAMGAAGVDVWKDYRDHANSWMAEMDHGNYYLTTTKER